MLKRHIYKGILIVSIIWSILAAVAILAASLSVYLVGAAADPMVSAFKVAIFAMIIIFATLCLVGFTLNLLYATNRGVWNTIHENREGIMKMIPDIVGMLISYGTIGLQWENRFKIDDEEES